MELASTAHAHRRQQLAWLILFVSFFLCMLLVVATPLAINAFIQNATLDLNATVQANLGTVGINDDNGVRSAALAGEPPQGIGPGSSVLTDTTANAILLITDPNTGEIVARLKIDSNTSMQLGRATTPRFEWSDESADVALDIENGRALVTLLEDEEHSAEIFASTPQGEVLISQPGQYSIDVNNQQTQVVVQEGAASAVAQDDTLILSERERGVIPTGQSPEGPFEPSRNLITNGDFSGGFDSWAQYAWKVELSDQPKGKTDVTTIDGEPVLRFARGGFGHADARVRQSLDVNVADYDAIQLLVTLRIQNQSLDVCGIQGSECPLFVRIDYVDENGVDQVWQHGFYAVGTADDNNAPGACISCAVIQSNHDRTPLTQEYYYSVNINEELARQGALPPSFIKSISLIGSGHSFIADVLDVALIVEE